MKRTIWTKFFGILTLSYAAINLWLVFYVMPARSERVETSGSIRFFFFELVITAVGIGLLYHRKWAALLFSMGLTAFALWLAISSIFYIPFPWMLYNFGFSLFLLLPVLVMKSHWRELTWKEYKLK